MNKQIPKTWTLIPLGKIASIKSGGTPNRDNSLYWGTDIPWVTPTDITRTVGRFLSDTQEGLSTIGLNTSSASTLPVGTILMTSRATVGESRIAATRVCTNQGFKSILTNRNVDPLFIFYQMQRCRERYKAFGIGSTFIEVNKKDTERFKILIPKNLSEQKSISTIIDSIDQTIEETEALIHKYQQIKQGLTHDLFTRGVTPDGKLRPPREQAPELYKETSIGWIPIDWDFVTIGNCTKSWAMGPRFSADEYNAYGNVATLRTTDIDQEGYVTYSTMPIANLKLDGYRNHILKQNDFVITRSGTCGLCAVFKKFPIPVLPGAFLIRFRFNESLSEEYLKNYLNSECGKQLVDRVAEGGVQKNLRGTSLCKIEFPRPKFEEQKRINIRLTTFDKLITDELKNKRKLLKQKSGLMQDLLTGKVRVKVAQEEPVHV